jgi:hypothetical protein
LVGLGIDIGEVLQQKLGHFCVVTIQRREVQWRPALER